MMTYKCKCCNVWEKAIPADWSDVVPRFCGNSRCELSMKKSKGKKGFRTSPEMLERVMPVVAPVVAAVEEPAKPTKNRKK
jgi:hypothetical protein